MRPADNWSTAVQQKLPFVTDSMRICKICLSNIEQKVRTLCALQEFLAAIARKRYKEVFLKDALKWKIRGSCLDSRWHIRDLLGRGSISQSKTTSGPLLRQVNKT